MFDQIKKNGSVVWCRDHKGYAYTFEEYLKRIQEFHGHVAPGLVIGGRMIDLALRSMPEEILFDVTCETFNCLPDAVQLLTPCTVGNGWLTILDLGRFALTFYDKYTGEGVRVFLDSSKVSAWPETQTWYMKLKPKQEQDSRRLMEEIQEAGDTLLSIQKVSIAPKFLEKRSLGKIAVCPLCKEAYPARNGRICKFCQGEAPYLSETAGEESKTGHPSVVRLPAKEAVGRRLFHDMTGIIPGKEKGPVFKNGDRITVGDICRLQQMGRNEIYVQDENVSHADQVHEDDAALAFGRAMAGDGVTLTLPPSEGKVNLTALRDGLFMVDEKRLETFNLVPGVMCAGRQAYTRVDKDEKLAGTRAVPLLLPKSDFNKAMVVLDEGPLFRVLPLRKASVGILVTGTEVFRGLIKDAFIPIITEKVEKFNCQVTRTLLVPDDEQIISDGVKKLLDAGVDLLVTTAGLSVDPEDVTRQGLLKAGITDILYGAPVLPGAMTLLGRIGTTQVIGVPACALYFKNTSFDLFLPRLLAGLTITRRDLAQMGHGAFCLECKTCTFPKCPFGK